MAETLAFICRTADVDPAIRAQRRSPELALIAVSGELAGEVERQGGAALIIQDYADGDADRDVRKKTVLWMDDWAEGRGRDGRSLKEFLCLDGFSLWWFALPALFPDIMRCIQYIDLVCEVLRREAPQRVLLGGRARGYRFPMHLNRDLYFPAAVIDLACGALGVETVYMGGRVGGMVARAKAAGARLGFALYHLLVKPALGLLRRTLAGRRRGRVAASGPKVVLFSCPVYWRECIDETGGVEFNDAIAGNCIRDLLRRGCDVMGIDAEVNVPRRRYLEAVGQKRRSNVEWRVLEDYQGGIALGANKEQKAVLRRLRRAWNAETSWRRGMRYRGVAMDTLFSGRFDYLFEVYFAEVLGYIATVDRVATVERPALFLIVYEEGPYGRAATIVGRKRGIPTLALQHGTLAGPHIPAYFFRRVSQDPDRDPVSCPIPDCTAVYGQRTRQMLTEVSAYPEHSVEVVGMPSYDSAIRALKDVGRSALCKTLGVDHGVPLVLVISQLMFTQENRNAYIATILDAAVNLAEVQWVIKLHPSESALDWEDAIRQRNVQGVHLVQGNIQLWVMACSVLVAWYSTTMIEAALLAKPVCAVFIPWCLNADMYVQDGIAVPVEDSNALVEYLREVGPDGGSVPYPSLDQHVHAPDGKASTRVADLAERLMASAGKPAARSDQ